MDGQTRFTFPEARYFATLPAWRSQAGLNMTKFGAKFQEKSSYPFFKRGFRDQNRNSVIHLINNNIKLFYSYIAKNKHHTKTLKNDPIVENMDYLYV